MHQRVLDGLECCARFGAVCRADALEHRLRLVEVGEGGVLGEGGASVEGAVQLRLEQRQLVDPLGAGRVGAADRLDGPDELAESAGRRRTRLRDLTRQHEVGEGFATLDGVTVRRIGLKRQRRPNDVVIDRDALRELRTRDGGDTRQAGAEARAEAWAEARAAVSAPRHQ